MIASILRKDCKLRCLRPTLAAGLDNNLILENLFGVFQRHFVDSSTPPPDNSRAGIADLCDIFHPESVDETSSSKQLEIMDPIFRDYGGKTRFSGMVSTVKCFENNPLVREALEEPGEGRVLVVDGGGSLRCALLGDQIAQMAADHGWKGVIVNGCIRDSEDISTMNIGVKALNTYPLKSAKRDPGLRDVPVIIAGVQVRPGNYLYADKDGVVVSKKPLCLKEVIKQTK
eukprot:CAMPEP_0196581536 /NCGR_PEP_ID=MMETSP1081-20130531/34059_1 /TAXON_ID=36882 /ORGANISM="Pyramimonas amylifera, Strain CCMP720" /LENGTH=228 /DNA_ID=CAMNT_0041901797 /DNA_START=56 /DNA_END=742 /DNA_ORIENTATION=-